VVKVGRRLPPQIRVRDLPLTVAPRPGHGPVTDHDRSEAGRCNVMLESLETGHVLSIMYDRCTVQSTPQPRPGRSRVNHQDQVMTAHPPGGEARFVAKGSHGHEGAPRSTRGSEPR
jgi:hypothetical protein